MAAVADVVGSDEEALAAVADVVGSGSSSSGSETETDSEYEETNDHVDSSFESYGGAGMTQEAYF